MSNDLQQAKAALAAGRRDEALVYAWNALSSVQGADLAELRRFAQELDDRSLLSELDSRGVPPVQVTPTVPVPDGKRKRGARIGRGVFVTFVLAFIAYCVSQIPVEPGPLRAGASDTVAFTQVRRVPTVGPGVYLVPMGNVRRVDVRALAREVSLRYHVPASTLPRVALPVWTLDVAEDALNGDQLIRVLQLTYPARGQAAVIGITDYDMFSTSLGIHGLFSLRDPVPYGVVSSSTLGASLFDRFCGHDRHERMRKLVARNIGFLYFHLPESADHHSLLRSSMSSVHDIDALHEDLPNGSR